MIIIMYIKPSAFQIPMIALKLNSESHLFSDPPFSLPEVDSSLAPDSQEQSGTDPAWQTLSQKDRTSTWLTNPSVFG